MNKTSSFTLKPYLSGARGRGVFGVGLLVANSLSLGILMSLWLELAFPAFLFSQTLSPDAIWPFILGYGFLMPIVCPLAFWGKRWILRRFNLSFSGFMLNFLTEFAVFYAVNFLILVLIFLFRYF
jgi:hypothetical protein